MAECVFITGGNGYVGRRFLRQSSDQGYGRILVLLRDPDALPRDLRQRADIEIVQGDLLEPDGWGSVVERAAYVVHLAAVTGKARPATYAAVHVQGTANLLRAAARAELRGLLHMSTIAVKFQNQRRYFYAQTKLRAEALVTDAGLPFTILRPTMITGPSSPVVEGLAKLANAPIMPVFGNGRALVQPIHVDDLVGLMQDLIREDRFRGEILEVGGSETVSIEDLMLRIRRVRCGKKERVVHLPLGFTRGTLGLMEPVLLPLLPLTAGQLSTFCNDGTAEASEYVDARRGGMRALDESLVGTSPDA